MLTTVGADEDQVARALRFAVVPLLYFPVATYCCVPLSGSVTLAGVMAIDVNVPAIAIVAAGEVTLPELALIVADLKLIPSTCANPVLLTLTTLEAEDTQVSGEVRVAVVPLL
jgi:hypothetical protein